MVKRKERKLEYAFKQKEKGEKNKDCAYLCGIGIRWFQKLYAEYKMTGKIPKLDKTRRPKTFLTEQDEKLIDKALKESKLNGSVYLRLYIKKYYGKTIPNNKIHRYLIKRGVAQQDEKKKKQRIYRLYERNHSFSLGHLDWHVSKCIPGKRVCVLIDDASREIASDEFDRELEEYATKVMDRGIKFAWKKYSSLWKQMNTDKGSQFYNNTKDKDGEIKINLNCF